MEQFWAVASGARVVETARDRMRRREIGEVFSVVVVVVVVSE